MPIVVSACKKSDPPNNNRLFHLSTRTPANGMITIWGKTVNRAIIANNIMSLLTMAIYQNKTKLVRAEPNNDITWPK